MDGPLVTKLYKPTPRPPARVVARPRLIERLNAGLSGKLTLLCAPAGFGKTTLVAEWIEERLETGDKRLVSGADEKAPMPDLRSPISNLSISPGSRWMRRTTTRYSSSPT